MLCNLTVGVSVVSLSCVGRLLKFHVCFVQCRLFTAITCIYLVKHLVRCCLTHCERSAQYSITEEARYWCLVYKQHK